MTINFLKNAAKTFFCAAILWSVSSCVKDHFTVPGPGANIDPPGIQATMTIKQFKQLYYVPILANPLPVLIPDSIVLTGIVNADDRSGNFYKTISLQDSTGGLQIKIGSSTLYETYPVGRRVWIKTKGLYIFNYGGTMELGGYIDLSGNYPTVGSLSTFNASSSIITGKWGLPVPIQKTTIAQLNFADYINQQSMLYEIDDVEFAAYDTAGNYADALTKASVNITLNDCSGGSLAVRSSGYANFAIQKPASGHGSIVGIYSYYSFSSSGNTQLTIRDTSDIRFTSAHRCQ